MVDVAGIEPATPCLQNSSATFRKSCHFNHRIENSRLSTSGRLCLGVRECGYLFVGSLQKSLHFPAIVIGAAT